MSSKTKALIALLGAALLWSSSATVPKLLFQHAPPFTVAFERFFIASLLILPLMLHSRKPKQFFPILLPLGIFNGFNIIFYYKGLSLTSANSASILGPTVPLIVALLSYVLIGERVSKEKFIGISVGLTGALCIILAPLFSHGSLQSGNFTGNIFLIGSTLCWSCYILYSRKILSKGNFDPILSTSINIFITTLCTGAAALLFHQPLVTGALLNFSYLSILLYAAIGVTLATFFLFQWAVQYISAATASLKEYIQPIFGIIINTIVLHEQFTGWFFVGSILVIIGVFLATRKHLTKRAAVTLFDQGE